MKPSLFALMVFITTALMGTSFTIGKIGLSYASPFLLAGLRFAIAGVLMAIFVVLFQRKHPRMMADWFRIVIIGFFQTTGVMGAIFFSLKTITAGESAILTFINPLLVVIFSSLFLQMRYRWMQWGGVILGFLGVFITLGGQLSLQIGTIIGFGGAVSFAIATLLIKRWGVRFDTWVLTAYQMLFGGILLLLVSGLFEDAFFVVNATSLFILLWLAVMASIVQFVTWFFLLKKGHPGKVSAFLFLAPFFGVISGWLILNEPVGPSLLAGGALIFAGIFAVNWPEKTDKSKFDAG
ncbi:MAG TPA: DMT family transporter [Bacillales bacterium]|nr:DMT family transporter [Bacillales bacterium]